MKTSELKKIVEDNGFLFRKTNNLNVYIDDKGGNLFSLQNLETIYVDIQRVVRTKSAKNVLRALLDYSETPLEEREEEKKYRLVFPKGYRKEKVYLGKVEDISSHNHGDYLNTTILDGFYKVIFTQKEIDEMPFDTNFFIKEEVPSETL